MGYYETEDTEQKQASYSPPHGYLAQLDLYAHMHTCILYHFSTVVMRRHDQGNL